MSVMKKLKTIFAPILVFALILAITAGTAIGYQLNATHTTLGITTMAISTALLAAWIIISIISAYNKKFAEWKLKKEGVLVYSISYMVLSIAIISLMIVTLVLH